MAINSTVFKVELQIADLDRHYYHDHSLTIARHPSETDERMMVRVLAFACHANEQLVFGKGLSTEDEPDLWLKTLTGEIELWIDVGQPDEKHVRRACGRSNRVFIYVYGGNVADNWWHQNQKHLKQLGKLAVCQVPEQSSKALATLVHRTMQIQCTIQDGEMMFTDGETTVQIVLQALKPAGEGQVFH